MTMLSDFFRFEADQRPDHCLELLGALDADRSHPEVSRLVRVNFERVLLVARNRMMEVLESPIVPFLVSGGTPDSYTCDCGSLPAGSLPPVVSLTTISSRLDKVLVTLGSVVRQSLTPHSVNLYVSQEPWLLDEGISPAEDALKRIADLGVNVFFTRNLGPYRKQIPVIRQLWNAAAPDDTPVVTIDDDVLYPPDIVERLVMHEESLESVVAHRGRKLIREEGGRFSYGEFPAADPGAGLLNLATGRNGIAYRLSFFRRSLDHLTAAYFAPTADDLWCKWITAFQGIGTVILEPRAAFDLACDFPEAMPGDKSGLFHKYNARGSNNVAMKSLEFYFQQVFGCQLTSFLFP